MVAQVTPSVHEPRESDDRLPVRSVGDTAVRSGPSSFRGRAALVTGGLGFVGSELCERLAAAGARVVIVDNLSPRARSSLRRGITLYSIDVRDTAAVRDVVALERPDTVFHLAAMHFVPDCEANPGECLSINVDGTGSLLHAVSSSPAVQRIVFASSGAVYEPSLDPHREDSKVRPPDIYGTSKWLGERMSARFSEASRLPVFVARLFNIYGPGETNPHLVPTVLQQAALGDIIELGDLSTERDYVFLDDVVDALLRLGLVRPRRRVTTVNVGTGSGVTGDRLVQAVASVLGRRLSVATAAGRMRATDRPRLVADVAQARHLLGWNAATRLDIGLRQCAARPLASNSAWGSARARNAESSNMFQGSLGRCPTA